MSIIVTIGGGDIDRKGTLKIDREIIRLSGKKHPKVLFIPTASSDSEQYWESVKKYFGTYLKCKTEVLFLIKEKPNIKEIKNKILNSDIVYVGGGNTLKMMRVWRKLGVDKILELAHKKGIVLCGTSAGSICWYEYGHSDSLAYYNKNKWKYVKVKGLGFIRGIHCPHYNSRTLKVSRRQDFHQMIEKVGGVGIAIEDNCAIEFVDDSYRVISSKPNMNAYTVYKDSKKIFLRKIKKNQKLSPVSDLYVK